MEESKKRDQSHLITLIGRRSNNTPNFALLIGAGASASSGVRTASQMIADWRRQLYEQSKSKEPLEKWLERQDWYEDDEEYAILFEKVCDRRSQRRIYIEECVKDAKPSWGYIYLSNIVAHNYFDVVFTPNFDDLLHDACFLYADLRPIVCAHDSGVVDIRVTSARPKIIKLHGDFLYDSIKNTITETESLEKNMRNKFMQFGTEYGLIVIGYGGNDRSIMDPLDTMLRSGHYFPHGLYWCRRKEDKVSRKLKRLMERETTHWLEIEGFDEFMAELHHGLDLTLPVSVSEPYKGVTERLNTFMKRDLQVTHPLIKADIEELTEQVQKFEQFATSGAPEEKFHTLVPYTFLGDREFNQNRYSRAIAYYEKALAVYPDDLLAINGIVLSFIYADNVEKALDVADGMVERFPTQSMSHWSRAFVLRFLNKPEDAIISYTEALKHETDRRIICHLLQLRSEVLFMAGKWTEALGDADQALLSNPKADMARLVKWASLLKLGRPDEAEKTLSDIMRYPDASDRAAVSAILGQREEMLAHVRAAIQKRSDARLEIRTSPFFVDYQEDPEFQKLVHERQETEEETATKED